ncbi:hypothetical protein NLO95_07870 [Pseudomonas syringae]|nr:hypothetical protein [Pseudomonas syringae]
MKIEVTDREAFVVGLLAGIWNEYLKLPEEHPTERQEFCSAIHACQDKVLARAGRRAINAESGE